MDQFSRDGEKWTRFFEMTLTKESFIRPVAYTSVPTSSLSGI